MSGLSEERRKEIEALTYGALLNLTEGRGTSVVYDALRDLLAESAALRTERDELRDRCEERAADLVALRERVDRPKCFYCAFGEEGPPATADELRAHIETCGAHPMAALRARVAAPASPDDLARVAERAEAAERERDRLHALLTTPEIADFVVAVMREAAHQRERWGEEHDASKAESEWYWTLGYLGGKALYSALAGDREKALHHTITAAALLANWHAFLLARLTPPTGAQAPSQGGATAPHSVADQTHREERKP